MSSIYDLDEYDAFSFSVNGCPIDAAIAPIEDFTWNSYELEDALYITRNDLHGILWAYRFDIDEILISKDIPRIIEIFHLENNPYGGRIIDIFKLNSECLDFLSTLIHDPDSKRVFHNWKKEGF